MKSLGRLIGIGALTVALGCSGKVETGSSVQGVQDAGFSGQGGAAGKGGSGGFGVGGSGGVLPEAGACTSPNPAGCFHNGAGCPAGYECANVGCAPSTCQCDSKLNTWACTTDCNGGTCVPKDASTQKQCGGEIGAKCGSEEWCEYLSPGSCGGGDIPGTCQPKPTSCPENCPGTCGCDHKTYCNECLAHAAGVDVAPPGTCPPMVDAGQVDCETAANLVQAQISGFACTAVVRVGYVTKALLGYQLVCSGGGGIDEQKAREVAQADTGFGKGQSLSGPNPADLFVFYEPPGDFGGVGVVGAFNGVSVFGGSIIWMGKGEINWPKTPWQSPDKLGGPECAISKWPSWRGFDVVQEGAYSDAEAQKALEVAWGTALPAGISKMQYIQNAAVLLYGRQVGMFNPDSGEWIVFINSMWLE